MKPISAAAKFINRNLLIPAIDFIYSPICFHCRHPITSQMYLCDECNDRLIKIDYKSGQHSALRDELHSHCKGIRDVYALYDFQPGGVLQTLIHDLKYQQKTNIGIYLGRQLGESIQKNYDVDASWILIPVPLHPVKQRERGYNQSYYIARGVEDITGAHIDIESVRRARKTRTQTKLSINDRKENVSSAFVWNVRKPPLHDRRIAIIDDVITTGATIAEIFRVIPGQAGIYSFSLGHAPLMI